MNIFKDTFFFFLLARYFWFMIYARHGVLLLLGADWDHALVGLKADNGQHIAVISVSILLPHSPRLGLSTLITAGLLCTRSPQSKYSASFVSMSLRRNRVIKKVILLCMPRDHTVEYLEFRLLWLFTFYSLSCSRLLASMLTSTARIPSKYATISNVLLQTWAASNTGNCISIIMGNSCVNVLFIFVSFIHDTRIKRQCHTNSLVNWVWFRRLEHCIVGIQCETVPLH